MARIEIASETSGKVLEVLVAPGEQVAVGDELILVEAMKMHLPLPAERAGKVADILVAIGDVIEEGQPVLVLEI